jgi:long-chain acyl-CoA synthetase
LNFTARKNGIKYSSREELVKNPEIIKLYKDRIDSRTEGLGQVEKVKKFTLLPQEFSQENGELTPTFKIKRKVISERYKDAINSMYTD